MDFGLCKGKIFLAIFLQGLQGLAQLPRHKNVYVPQQGLA